MNSSVKIVAELSISSLTWLESVLEFAEIPTLLRSCSPALSTLSIAVASCHVPWVLKMANDDPTFISEIITGDAIWLYSSDPATKQTPSQQTSRQSPRPLPELVSHHNYRSALITQGHKSAVQTEHALEPARYLSSTVRELYNTTSYTVLLTTLTDYAASFCWYHQ